jgi:hypothetical protein
MESRTSQQNRALHLYLTMLSDALNDAGLDQRKVLKPGVSIPWTPSAAKEQLWRPIQVALFQKESTTELDKTKELDKVHEVLMRHLGEKFGIEYIPFPVDEKKQLKELEGYKLSASEVEVPEMNDSNRADKF